MITFEPIEFKDRLHASMKTLDFLSGEIDGISFDDIFENNQEDPEDLVMIDENSTVSLDLWEADYATTTFKNFLAIIESLNTATLNDVQSYAKNNHEVNFLLDVTDSYALSFLGELAHSENPTARKSTIGTEFWKTNLTINNIEYEISLFNGVCLYHILVEQSGNHDEYYPSYTDSDYFIRITSTQDINMADCNSLAISFIFELQATQKLLIEFSNGRFDLNSTDEFEDEVSTEPYKIFPLLYGKGFDELLTLYNKAHAAYDTDYKILYYTKVIEYISPTIAQQDLYRQVQLKLASPIALHPTADFINELGAIYTQNKNSTSKDRDLIRLAIVTTTDILEIWDDISNLMKKYANKSVATLDSHAQADCLELLSTIIYDTRNEIAHAKANYTKKGNECSIENKSQFCTALDKIAIRCIRWFAIQPNDQRATLSY